MYHSVVVCLVAFAELQTEVLDLASSDQGSDVGAAFCDFTSYAFKTLFPAQTDLRHRLCHFSYNVGYVFYPCHAIATAQVMQSYVVRPSVRPSVCLPGVTLKHGGHISWATWKVINWLTVFALCAHNVSDLVQGNTIKFGVE